MSDYTEQDWKLAERHVELTAKCDGHMRPIPDEGGRIGHVPCPVYFDSKATVCATCGRRGYVPHVTTDGLLDVLESRFSWVTLWRKIDEYRVVAADRGASGWANEGRLIGKGKTRLDALKAAVLAMEVVA